MDVNVHFSPEIEAILVRRAAAAGQDVASFVEEIVAENLVEDSVPVRSAASHAEFKARLQEVIDLHPVRNGTADDSRESIYAGRGE